MTKLEKKMPNYLLNKKTSYPICGDSKKNT